MPNVSTAQLRQFKNPACHVIAGIVEAPKRASRESLGGYRSKIERAYASHLDIMHIAGEVYAHRYEFRQFPVGKTRRRYTPDFEVTFSDGRIEYHETKGHCREKDKIRMDVVAAEFPDVVFYIVIREGRQWIYKRIHNNATATFDGTTGTEGKR